MANLEDTLEREGISLAPNRKRALAYVIDDLLLTLIIIAMVWEKLTNAPSTEAVILIVNSAIAEIFILRVLYQTLFVWYYGATLGKMFLKMRVIGYDLDKPTFLISLFRALLRAVNEVLFYFGFIFAFFDNLRQTLHDKGAKTLVVDAY